MPTLVDLTNKHFGRLTVEERAKDRLLPSGRPVVFWLCKCRCGKHKEICSGSLTSGDTRSCGCLRKEQTSLACRLKPSVERAVLSMYRRTKSSLPVARRYGLSPTTVLAAVHRSDGFVGPTGRNRPSEFSLLGRLKKHPANGHLSWLGEHRRGIFRGRKGLLLGLFRCTCPTHISPKNIWLPIFAYLGWNMKACNRAGGHMKGSRSEAALDDYYRSHRNNSKSGRHRLEPLSRSIFIRIVLAPRCLYCNEPAAPYICRAERYNHSKRVGSPAYVCSIDRYVNDVGYKLGNCVPCCIGCNLRKKEILPAHWWDWLSRFLSKTEVLKRRHRVEAYLRRQKQWRVGKSN